MDERVDGSATLVGVANMLRCHDAGNSSVNLFQALVEQAPDAVIFADRDGTIQVWNLEAERVIGYSAAEVVKTSLDVIIPERLQRAHWEGFRKAIESGQTKYVNRVLTTRSMHKDGHKLYVDLSFGLVRDRAGAVIGALAIGRDCTARYLSDQSFRASVVELEQKLKMALKQT